MKTGEMMEKEKKRAGDKDRVAVRKKEGRRGEGESSFFCEIIKAENVQEYPGHTMWGSSHSHVSVQ